MSEAAPSDQVEPLLGEDVPDDADVHQLAAAYARAVRKDKATAKAHEKELDALRERLRLAMVAENLTSVLPGDLPGEVVIRRVGTRYKPLDPEEVRKALLDAHGESLGPAMYDQVSYTAIDRERLEKASPVVAAALKKKSAGSDQPVYDDGKGEGVKAPK